MIDELKKENFNRNDPPVYAPIRRVSVYLSWACIRLNVSPDLISIAGFACILAACYFLITRNWQLAPVFILISYLLDCMDGEVARGSGKAGIRGTQLEHLIHWVAIGLLQTSLCMGYYLMTNSQTVLMLSMVSILSWINFYYFVLQFRVWIPPDKNYALLKKMSRYVFFLMPLDENLIIVFGLMNQPRWLFFANVGISSLLFLAFTVTFFAYRFRDRD